MDIKGKDLQYVLDWIAIQELELVNGKRLV
jgi:hypothetical protein